MPVFDPAVSSVTPQAIARGLTCAEIIRLATVGTDDRGKNLDKHALLLFVLQELCKETRWYWRRVNGALTLTVGTQMYDLNDDGVGLTDVEQIATDGVKLVGDNGTITVLPPVWDGDQQAQIFSNPQAGDPTGYFVDGNSILVFDKVPTAARQVRVSFWAVPSYRPDTLPEAVPLVPYHLHALVEKWLEEKILEYTEAGKQYIAVKSARIEMLSRALLKTDFADGRVTTFADPSREAVQST